MMFRRRAQDAEHGMARARFRHRPCRALRRAGVDAHDHAGDVATASIIERDGVAALDLSSVDKPGEGPRRCKRGLKALLTPAC